MNIKLAFERYMDFIRIQRRESMLQWCLEPTSDVIFLSNSNYNYNSSYSYRTWKQGIFTSSLIQKIVNPQLTSIISMKKHIRLIKRDFTSTTTRFFNNNFDALVEDDTSSYKILEEANKKFEEISKELKFFDNKYPEKFTPDIITKVSKLFDWLYTNKQFQIAYLLLHKITPNYNIFFKFNQYSKMIEVFDMYGKTEDLFQFCETFKYDKIPNIWRKLERLNNDKYVSKLINLSAVNSFQEAKNLLDDMLLDISPKGLKYFAFRVCSLLYKNFDTDSRMKLYEYLTNLKEPLKKYFPPSLIAQIFLTYQAENKCDSILQYNFLEQYMLLHYDPLRINEESYQYKLISSLPKENLSTLKFKLWFDYCYNKQPLKYDSDIQSIIYLKNNKLHYLPKKFECDLNVDKIKLDTMISVLIFAHSKYDPTSPLTQTLFHLKNKLKLPINHSDNIGYLKSLTGKKEYNKAAIFLQKCLKENPFFESDETLNPILIVLAKNKKWKELESIYTERYEHNEIISKEQYITLFIALAVRPGTNKIIMQLWENFLKRGFDPNDQILSSVIMSLINNKSYEEALQWFTAYSHYNVELTSKSYGLMLHALAGLKNNESVFKVLDELIKKPIKIPKQIFPPIFNQFASLGDFKSVETILTTYYPKFNLSVDREDSRWIMQCHYHANRFSFITDSYLKMGSKEVTYKDSLLALDSAIKFSDLKIFRRIWNKTFDIHKARGDLDISAYILYMAYWVRKHGGFGIELKLQEITKNIKIEQFPSKLFNQMIFSCLRTHRPWLTKKILKIALNNGVIPSPKTYSLILQSNVCMPWVARNSIDETCTILEEFLMDRKEDKFGKLNDDLNPMALKMVIKSIIKYKDVYEARRLFDLYVETSRDNLLDNMHILNIELMLLGEEERWIDFDGCYDRYMKLLFKLIEKARFKDEKLNLRFNNNEFKRLDVYNDAFLRTKIDEFSVRNVKDMNVKIPNWIKKANSDIWGYRLKQLEIAERISEINDIIKKLRAKGLVFDNKNFNDTALFLSNRPNLLEECVSFIDKYILPYHIKNQRFKMMRIRYATEEIPEMRKKPIYQFNRGVYFEVMKNISSNFNEKLSSEQREGLMNRISSSPNKYFLKNLDQISDERRHIRSSYLQTKKLRTIFYRNLRIIRKQKTRKTKKRMSMWRLNEAMNYRAKMDKMKKDMDKIIWKKHHLTSGRESDKNIKRIIEASDEAVTLEKEKKALRGRMNSLRKEGRKELNYILKKRNTELQNLKPYMVGKIDLSKV